jgi:hypothetical protein
MFGTGSAVAHRAVDSVMGPRSMEMVHKNEDGSVAENQTASAPAPSMASGSQSRDSTQCNFELGDYQRCLQNNNFSVDACRNAMDVLSQCQNAFKTMH